MLKPSAQVTKGGTVPQFCIQFYANYTILATQRGGHGPMPPPLNTPLGIVIICMHCCLINKMFNFGARVNEHQSCEDTEVFKHLLNNLSFIMLAVLRQSVSRVGGAHLCIITPGQHSFFSKMSQRWRAIDNTTSDLTSPRFKPQTYASETNALSLNHF